MTTSLNANFPGPSGWVGRGNVIFDECSVCLQSKKSGRKDQAWAATDMEGVGTRYHMVGVPSIDGPTARLNRTPSRMRSSLFSQCREQWEKCFKSPKGWVRKRGHNPANRRIMNEMLQLVRP